MDMPVAHTYMRSENDHSILLLNVRGALPPFCHTISCPST